MTATSVRGLAVIEDQPTESPIPTPGGHRVVWQQTRTLLLEDGSTTYGCVHCDYTSLNVLSIRPHLNAHRVPGQPRRPRKTAVDVSALTLEEIGRRLAEVDRLTAERDGWKKRALAAEKSLRTLRTALQGIAPTP